MRYTTTLATYRKQVWREYIDINDDLPWEDCVKWTNVFLTPKQIRFLYKALSAFSGALIFITTFIPQFINFLFSANFIDCFYQ